MGGPLGVSAPLCEAGVVCFVCPRAALAKTVNTKTVLIRIILAPIPPERALPRAASLIFFASTGVLWILIGAPARSPLNELADLRKN
jgi:hypothetical protein